MLGAVAMLRGHSEGYKAGGLFQRKQEYGVLCLLGVLAVAVVVGRYAASSCLALHTGFVGCGLWVVDPGILRVFRGKGLWDGFEDILLRV